MGWLSLWLMGVRCLTLDTQHLCSAGKTCMMMSVYWSSELTRADAQHSGAKQSLYCGSVSALAAIPIFARASGVGEVGFSIGVA